MPLVVLAGVPVGARGAAEVGPVAAEAGGDDADVDVGDRLELALADGAGVGGARRGRDDVAEAVDARRPGEAAEEVGDRRPEEGAEIVPCWGSCRRRRAGRPCCSSRSAGARRRGREAAHPSRRRGASRRARCRPPAQAAVPATRAAAAAAGKNRRSMAGGWRHSSPPSAALRCAACERLPRPVCHPLPRLPPPGPPAAQRSREGPVSLLLPDLQARRPRPAGSTMATADPGPRPGARGRRSQVKAGRTMARVQAPLRRPPALRPPRVPPGCCRARGLLGWASPSS